MLKINQNESKNCAKYFYKCLTSPLLKQSLIAFSNIMPMIKQHLKSLVLENGMQTDWSAKGRIFDVVGFTLVCATMKFPTSRTRCWVTKASELSPAWRIKTVIAC